MRYDHDDAIAFRVYPVYQQQLLTANAVDFDDLLFHVARLLRENPEIRARTGCAVQVHHG